ncbi:hypothetical protein, partial [Pseudomonas viridiflava]|uniref:hypothetical protein n=1 Tax=Pseudomonas viridiflava TaxID=33069 RepID=UPI001F11B6EE
RPPAPHGVNPRPSAAARPGTISENTVAASITPAPKPSKPSDTAWRETAAGPRGSSDQNTSQRFLLNFDGLVGGWDYNVGASY